MSGPDRMRPGCLIKMERRQLMSNIKTWWMGKWNGFEKNHPKLAKWVYQIFCGRRYI